MFQYKAFPIFELLLVREVYFPQYLDFEITIQKFTLQKAEFAKQIANFLCRNGVYFPLFHTFAAVMNSSYQEKFIFVYSCVG